MRDKESSAHTTYMKVSVCLYAFLPPFLPLSPLPSPSLPSYLSLSSQILRMFLDKKDSEYSLHMIGESGATGATHHYAHYSHPQLTRGQILVVQLANGSDPTM